MEREAMAITMMSHAMHFPSYNPASFRIPLFTWALFTCALKAGACRPNTASPTRGRGT
jgi:hypothetical protein